MSDINPLEVSEYKNIKHNIGNGRPTLLAFGMSHCYSCLAMSKVLLEVVTEHPQLQIFSIDSQRDRIISRDLYKLREMPTQIFFDPQGNEVFRHSGAYKRVVFDIILKKYGFL